MTIRVYDKLGGRGIWNGTDWSLPDYAYPILTSLSAIEGWAQVSTCAVPLIMSTYDAAGYGAGIRWVYNFGTVRRTEEFGNDHWAEVSIGPVASTNDASYADNPAPGVSVRQSTSADTCYELRAVYYDFDESNGGGAACRSSLFVDRVVNGTATLIHRIDLAPEQMRDDWWFIQLQVWGSNPVNLRVVVKAPSEYIANGNGVTYMPDFTQNQYYVSGTTISHTFASSIWKPNNETNNTRHGDYYGNGYYYDHSDTSGGGLYFGASYFTSPKNNLAWPGTVWTGTDSAAEQITSGYPGMRFGGNGFYELTQFSAGQLTSGGDIPNDFIIGNLVSPTLADTINMFIYKFQVDSEIVQTLVDTITLQCTTLHIDDAYIPTILQNISLELVSTGNNIRYINGQLTNGIIKKINGENTGGIIKRYLNGSWQ